MNPSSETESPVRTFPMMVPSSAPKFAARNSGLVLDLLRA
jgi:hypothetical protein